MNDHGEIMKVFYLQRKEDESGVSGTGRIAQGIIFDNGKVALTWLSDHPSVTVYDNVGEVRAIHGHEGKTELVMEPDWKRACGEMKAALKEVDIFQTVRDKLPEGAESKDLLDKN